MIELKDVIHEVKEIKKHDDIFEHYKKVHMILKIAIKNKRDILDIKDEMIEHKGKKIIKTVIWLDKKVIHFKDNLR